MKPARWLLLIPLVIILIIAGVLWLRSRMPGDVTPEPDKTNSEAPQPTSQLDPLDPPQKVLVPNPDLKHAAWIPDWGSASGLESLKSNAANLPAFTTISPVWYEVKEDGSLLKKFPANRKDLISWLKANNVKLVPTVAMFDHELFTKVLQDPVALEKHINAIVEEVRSNSYDGIDLDYESTKLSDKEQFFTFLSGVSRGIHAQGKLLTIAVLPKWGDEITYPSLKETRAVQDWSMIAPYTDTIRIMAYDYTYSKSALPGPIAPTDWVKDVLEYALTKAPAAKFELGIALYAYQWSAAGDNPDFNYTVNFLENTAEGSSASAYQYKEVEKILAANQGESTEFQNESLYQYAKSGKKYALSYFTPQNIKAHIDLAKEYGLNGVCYWRLGNEGKLLSLAKD